MNAMHADLGEALDQLAVFFVWAAHSAPAILHRGARSVAQCSNAGFRVTRLHLGKVTGRLTLILACAARYNSMPRQAWVHMVL